jgi:hypothetical protein
MPIPATRQSAMLFFLTFSIETGPAHPWNPASSSGLSTAQQRVPLPFAETVKKITPSKIIIQQLFSLKTSNTHAKDRGF